MFLHLCVILFTGRSASQHASLVTWRGIYFPTSGGIGVCIWDRSLHLKGGGSAFCGGGGEWSQLLGRGLHPGELDRTSPRYRGYYRIFTVNKQVLVEWMKLEMKMRLWKHEAIISQNPMLFLHHVKVYTNIASVCVFSMIFIIPFLKIQTSGVNTISYMWTSLKYYPHGVDKFSRKNENISSELMYDNS